MHWRVNLADQNKQQQQEDACHVPYMTSQYETNHCLLCSLLLNRTEALATQAIVFLSAMPRFL